MKRCDLVLLQYVLGGMSWNNPASNYSLQQLEPGLFLKGDCCRKYYRSINFMN
jgi:hypothetical protein